MHCLYKGGLTLDLNEIRQLAALMQEMELSILEISESGKIIKLEKKSTAITTFAPSSVDAEKGPEAKQHIATPVSDTITVVAPMVGVFYASPSPGAAPFVSIGTKIKQGDVLCIIEAMKLMNEISAEQDGTICEVCVSNGQVVEYGHPIFRIKR